MCLANFFPKNQFLLYATSIQIYSTHSGPTVSYYAVQEWFVHAQNTTLQPTELRQHIQTGYTQKALYQSVFC